MTALFKLKLMIKFTYTIFNELNLSSNLILDQLSFNSIFINEFTSLYIISGNQN